MFLFIDKFSFGVSSLERSKTIYIIVTRSIVIVKDHCALDSFTQNSNAGEDYWNNNTNKTLRKFEKKNRSWRRILLAQETFELQNFAIYLKGGIDLKIYERSSNSTVQA